ncbi:hypothetical protein MHYP_G00311560 [Metynnis hypsauchen]
MTSEVQPEQFKRSSAQDGLSCREYQLKALPPKPLITEDANVHLQAGSHGNLGGQVNSMDTPPLTEDLELNQVRAYEDIRHSCL